MRRTIKNVVKNYTDAQIKVREATSNDPWGPSSTLMSEIADLTYNVMAFTEIMQMIWKRLNDHGKNWRHVYKALMLLDYIIKTGSEKVAQQCKENIYAIQTLKDFQYVEDNKDHGMNVREKAKQLVQLLKDDERLKNERAKALKAKERFAQNSMGIGSGGTQQYRPSSASPTMHSSQSGYEDTFRTADAPSATTPTDAGAPVNPEVEAARPNTAGEEELQLQLALAMSKEEHDAEERRRRGDDMKLQMALEESKKEHSDGEGPTVLPAPTGHLPAPAGHPHKKANQDTLLDLIGNQTATSQAPLTDPWGGPITSQAGPSGDPWGQPSPKPPVQNDPWVSPARQPEVSVPAPQSDPWSTPSSAVQSTPVQQPAVQSDPWGAPPNQTQPQQASTWGSPAQTNGTVHNNTGTIDDAFDLLSSRPPGGPTNTSTNNGLYPSGNSSSPAFDMSVMNQALPPMIGGDPLRKSPADFLGANANLVNLDNLVTKPKDNTSTNPFALTIGNNVAPAPNPFALQQQQQRSNVTLNQMAMTQPTTTGFPQQQHLPQQPLPVPLIPGAGGYAQQGYPMGQPTGYGQPMPIQPQSNNPFL